MHKCVVVGQDPLKGRKINLRGCKLINGTEKNKQTDFSLIAAFFF